MAFLNKFFTGTAKDEAETLSEETIKVRVASRPMRKLNITIDGNEETQKITEVRQNEEKGIQKNTKNNSLLKLKNLAEQIRHRVHYIDKNDFAKKAVSNKDKVYDYDLRKDLAYFLANEKLFVSDELEAMGGRAEADLIIFEELIRRAIGDERIGYVVYGERTYVIEYEAMRDTKHGPASTRREDNTLMRGGTRNVQQKAENKEQGTMNKKKEMQNTKHKTQSVEQEAEERVAGLSMADVEIFRKSGVEFLENLRRESKDDSIGLITEGERNTLLKIFTKRFLREIIIEKENFLKTKRSFELKRTEELVEFICNSIF